MAFDFGFRLRDGASPALLSALKRGGRVVLWGLIAVLLVRGGISVLVSPSGERDEVRAASIPPATEAFAVRFARAYLADPGAPATRALLARGARLPRVAPAAGGVGVAQAEVAGVRGLGGGRSTVTVACELGDGRTLHLAVPVLRSGPGALAVEGAPALVAGPATGTAAAEAPRPLTGAEASAIADLLRRFLPAYLAPGGRRDLSYLLAPGAEVRPPGAGLRLVAVGGVAQLGDGEGPWRTAVATVRVRDAASGATFPLAYRVEVVRRGRWYVESVQGALS